jgi:zinc transport system substrate-binding protein
MYRLAYPLLFILLVAQQAFAEQKLPVTVSILPQKYFVEQIGGDHVKVNVMVPPGAEPEDYDPTPKQIAGLANSKLYFAVGVPFEQVWLKRFVAANPRLKIVDTQQRIAKMPLVANHLHHRAINIKDPHVWLSPPLVRLQAMEIRDALIHQDPQHEADYRRNYQRFALAINKLDNQLLAIFAKLDGKAVNKFMTFHPAWGYFADNYGLQQIAIEDAGKEPGAKRLQQLIDQAKANHIRVIFVEPQFSQKAARTIAKQIKGDVVAVDPLAEDWPANLIKVAEAFRDAIQKD